jgi:hypothetical protein
MGSLPFKSMAGSSVLILAFFLSGGVREGLGTKSGLDGSQKSDKKQVVIEDELWAWCRGCFG